MPQLFFNLFYKAYCMWVSINMHDFHIKWIVHPKMTFLVSFTHLHEILSSAERKSCFEKLNLFFHTAKACWPGQKKMHHKNTNLLQILAEISNSGRKTPTTFIPFHANYYSSRLLIKIDSLCSSLRNTMTSKQFCYSSWFVN